MPNHAPWLLILGLLVCTTAPARADDQEHGFISKVFKDKDGKSAKYIVFIPFAYKGDKPYPTILFLHGKNQTGNDGLKQIIFGLGPAITRDEKAFPFIVVFPQSQESTWQAKTEDADRALDILAEVKQTWKVDEKRTYLTGLSMGGFGTWSLAAAYPDRWAAIVPICGGGNPEAAEKIKHIPCWCFHGDADQIVSVEKSRKMIAAIKAAGGSPKYTEYPGVDHTSWLKAYATKELYDWLLEQKLK